MKLCVNFDLAFGFVLQSRSQLLPGIVMLLQKMWRGAIARKRYRRMLAVRRIIEAYRQYRMRKYILQLCKAFKYSFVNFLSPFFFLELF